ncbi:MULTISPECIES: M24 family metallopeptidase [Mycobacterium]|uniref:Peptidase n=1 Tax=Mycobacterium kiyosense TaxID=2871094 RepID=A0A9P3QAB0_9MYCO|nr:MULTISPECIES: Xaa-Pro peptidase family protein [Mycobacterium]BDB45020.1 peptidase [Mycobacterium kiyosense]BDE16501.1 peptidase [Mycobacterium sp. 20KCMC460]GLB85334.1 peptidase [Mycobacterium kiyosense]GLB89716.1 peptidase [Mycobacterium kiyosense]GLB98115.1 peptidase [Mycobacterium kiyosense]
MSTITDGMVIPEAPDLPRLRRETGARLRAAMADRGVDALVLLGNNAVVYATGTSWPLGDAGLSYVERPVAVVLADDESPHLFLPFREGAAQESDLPADHRHGPVYLEFDEGVADFAGKLAELIPAGSTVAVDEFTGAMSRARNLLFPNGTPVDAAAVISAAKAVKTPDELACIRTAVRITDQAMVEVQQALAPGIRQVDLSGRFLRRAFELGAMASMLEPIWQVMPNSRAEGVWTTHGDLALPLLSTERELCRGDVLWTDVSITYQGYCSDFGRTWIVGQDPSPRQQAQFDKWRQIMDAVLGVARAGATAADLGRAATAANGGVRPWLPHFYLGHGIGVNAAEMPMIGTDLGDEFDENFVLQPGMVLVLEPVVWEDGTGGYRSEEVLVITEEGSMKLTDYPYDPYVD